MARFVVLSVLLFGLQCTWSINLCPPPWAEFKGECLFFSRDSRNYVDAENDCRRKQAYLASDDNADKHNFIRQVLSAFKGVGYDGFYLGADDFVFEGQWRWIETGLPVNSFVAWGTGMPQGEQNHNCMKLAWEDNEAVWVDEDCNQRRHYICEKQAVDFKNMTSVIGR